MTPNSSFAEIISLFAKNAEKVVIMKHLVELQKRHLFGLALIALASSAIIAGCVWLLIENAYQQTEINNFRQNLHLTIKYVEQRRTELEKLVEPIVSQEFEYWVYYNDKNKLREKIVGLSKSDMALDVAVLFDQEQHPIYGFKRNGEKLVDMSEDEMKPFTRDDSFLQFRERGGSRSTFTNFEDTTYVVAAKQAQSKNASHVLGSLMIGQRWSANGVSRLSESLDLDIRFQDLAQIGNLQKHKNVLGLMTGANTWAITNDNDQIKGYVALYDSLENPTILLEIKPSKFAGEKFRGIFGKTILGIGVGLTLLLGFFINGMHKQNLLTQKYNQLYRNEEKKIKALMQAIPGYVSWVDKDMKYIEVSASLANAIGKEPEDFWGRKLGSVNKEDTTEFLEKVAGSFKGNGSAEVFTHQFRTKNGLRNVIAAARSFDQGGQTVVVGIDITDFKKLTLDGPQGVLIKKSA